MVSLKKLFANCRVLANGPLTRKKTRFERCPARLTLEPLEARSLPASFGVAGTVLTVTGTSAADTVMIRDYGNAADPIDINLNDGAGWRYLPMSITRININTGGGNDFVQYQLMDNLQTGVSREVWTNLGSGEDDFYAYLDDGVTGSDLLWGSSLKLIVQGGDGRDILGVYADWDVDVQAGASLLIDLAGQNHADNVFVNYRGELDGTLYLYAGGGSGNDWVQAHLTFDAGSDGWLAGTSARGVGNDFSPAFLSGGSGDDTVRFIVDGDLVDGAYGWDL